MKIAGLFLLLAGWGLVLAALGMLHPGGARTIFISAGLAVEAMGLGLAVISHRSVSSPERGRERGRNR